MKEVHAPRSPRASDAWPTFLFLRALGLIFACAFGSLWTQIRGLVGVDGILPANQLLEETASQFPGLSHFWAAPTLLWLDSSDAALSAICCIGLCAGVALLLNFVPRVACAVATLSYLSWVAVAQVFGHYQSDGMLLEAGLLSCVLSPAGFFPKVREHRSTSWVGFAALLMLRWEWFRLYFESGLVKWVGGDPQWHALTALDHYYENGPLPTWLGWYAQERLPHAFHAGCALATLLLEIFGPLVIFLPRRARWPRRIRLAVLVLCTLFQLGIALTANYAFINHLAIALGLVLLDDEAVSSLLSWLSGGRLGAALIAPAEPMRSVLRTRRNRLRNAGSLLALALFALMFWTTLLVFPVLPTHRLPEAAWKPAEWLEPFRVANRFGLFGRMTDARYELEFQGSLDGKQWRTYPFRRKPQDPMVAPGIYAPHQPRFDWNLWFASLSEWREEQWTLLVCADLLEGKEPVRELFAGDPFEGALPQRCRIMRWQYWFTTPAEKAATGAWWRREELGLWAPVVVKRGEHLYLESADVPLNGDHPE